MGYHILNKMGGESMTKKISLKGCFPPIPTPFDSRSRVDHKQLALNLEKWQKTPLAGFAVLGSNGEAVSLKEEEKLETWQTARAAIHKDRLFIAGTGCESTDETLELTEKAAKIGADAALVVTPHYNKGKMDHRALVNITPPWQTSPLSPLFFTMYLTSPGSIWVRRLSSLWPLILT
jgi:4-hydroxy-2-oxoglutarate aldolase